MRLLSVLILTMSMAAAAQGRGVEGTAMTSRDVGFIVVGADPLGMTFEEGIGRASLRIEDRVTSGISTFGDERALSAELRVGPDRYRIELEPGRRAQIGGAPAGGAAINLPVHGGGLGLPMAVRAHAAFALTGVGSVYRNDRLLTDQAVIYGFALAEGTHSDDSSHSLLNQARAGDAEIEILVTNLPSEIPGGMLRIFYDDVSISVGGTAIPTVLSAIDNVPRQNPNQVAAPRNYGTTLLPQTTATQDAAQQTRPIDVANRLDVTGGQVVGFRRFVNGVQVEAGGVDDRRSANDADARQGTGGSGTAGGALSAAGQTGVDSTAGTESFTTAPQSTGVDDSIRVANSAPGAPFPPTPRPLNSYAAPTLPAGISPLSADPLVPLPPTVRPANSDPVAPVTRLEPVNPNAPAIGTSVEQFPGLTPTSTTGGFAQGTSTVGLPFSGGTTTSTNVGVGGSGLDGTGVGGLGLGTGANATGAPVLVSPGAADIANNTVPGTGISPNIVTLPGPGVNPANIPGTSTGGFAGQQVVGGSGTFPGLTPSGTGAPAGVPPSGAQAQ